MTRPLLALALALALSACGGGDGASDAPDTSAPDAQDVAPAPSDAVGDSVPELDAGPEAVTIPCAGLTLVPVPTTPIDPCAEDLDTLSGVVVPDLGTVTCREAWGHDPSVAGPYQKIIETDAVVPNPVPTHDDITVRVYAAAQEETSDALPLVVVLHGFGARLESMQGHSRHLASHGFAVVAVTFPNTGFTDPAAHDLKVAEVRGVLDWAFSDANPERARLDPDKVAVAGHSLGGKIAFGVASEDPRVDLVIGMDPSNSGGPPCAVQADTCNSFPFAPNCQAPSPGVLSGLHAESLVFAAEDKALTPDAHLRATQFYKGAPGPAHLLHFPAASHAAWIKEGAESTFTRGVATALLLTRFLGRPDLGDWLPPAGARVQEQLGALLDDVRSKPPAPAP